MNKLFEALIIGLIILGCKDKSAEKEVTEEKVVFNQDLADELKKMAEVDQIAAYIPQGEYKKTYLGEVIKFYKKIGVAEVIINTKGLKKGQKILITGKKTPATFFEVADMQIEHKPVEAVKKGEKVGIKLPFEVRKLDKVFLWEDE